MNSNKKFNTVKEAENYIFEVTFSRKAPDNYFELSIRAWDHFVNNVESYAGTGEEFLMDLGVRSNIQMILDHLNKSALSQYINDINLSDQKYLEITTDLGKCILVDCERKEGKWWYSRIPKALPKGLVPSLLVYCNKEVVKFINII